MKLRRLLLFPHCPLLFACCALLSARCLLLVTDYFLSCFKTWGTSIGVPIGVPLSCNIWTSFWNILMSYFSYSVMKAMEPGWSFVKKLDRGRASFLRYWHLKFTPEKPNSYITISVSKLQVPCCSPYRGRTFPHSCALLRSLVFTKTHFVWN